MRFFRLCLIFVFFAAAVFNSCDIELFNPTPLDFSGADSPEPEGPGQDGPFDGADGPFDPLDPGSNPYFPNLDPAYNYLFILNVPPNTAAAHLSKVAIANAGGVIARCASYSAVLVSDAGALAVPLSYNNGASFTETGLFAVGFDITVDAVSRVSFDVKDGRLVKFKGGNGILDLNDLPPSTPMPDVPGHYLTIINLPPNTQAPNISGVFVENIAKQIAKCQSYGEIAVKENAAFIPLVNTYGGGAFTENGMFYVSVTILADAVNTVTISKKDGFLVNFYEGNGVLDLNNPPTPAPPPASISGPVLTVLNLPPFTSTKNISAVRVGLSSNNIVAVCNSFFMIEVIGNAAYIPLVFNNTSATFDSTGVFFTAISIFTDAFNQIVITLNEKVAVEFLEGCGVLDLSTIKKDILAPNPSDPDDPTNPDYTPLPGDNPESPYIPGGGGSASDGGSDGNSGKPAFLTVLNLPPNTSSSSFSQVQVNNNYSVIAKCSSYQDITVTDSTAEIPIVSGNDQPFHSSGYFYFSLVIDVDINTNVTIRPNDKKISFFTNGSAVIDLNNLQTEFFDPLNPDATIQSTIILINLPDNTSPLNISDVFVGNSTTTVAKAVDQVDFSVLGNTAFIPITYINGAVFTESGNFYVSFTIVVDALTTVKRALSNKCLYHFSNGGTIIDLSALPPVQEHNLTIFNLPVYTINPNVSEATVYDLNGNLASTAKLENISVKNGTAVIPLVYEDDTKIDFFGTGAFYISFTITVDAVTKIQTTLDDHLLVNFTDGNGAFDITHIPEKPDDPHNLILYNLPANAMAANIINVKIHNTQSEIAQCLDYSAITVINSQAVIPLLNTADNTPFVMDGFFYLELTVFVDALHQYVITRDKNSLCEFYNGNGSFDIQSVTNPGYFSGGLLNESDTKAPILKAGTAFEINGGYVKLYDNVYFPQLEREDSALKIVYLYAYETGQNLEQNYYGVRAQGTYQNIAFVYSTEEPVFNAAKNAYYLGNARALFKFLFVREAAVSTDRYLVKTYAKDDFPAFKIVVPSPGGSLQKTYLGEENRPPADLTLQSGIYCFEVVGAGGGGGGGAFGEETLRHTYYETANNNTSSYYYDTFFNYCGGSGGAGGKVIEVVYFNSAKILEIFTGSGGQGSYENWNITGFHYGGGGGGGGGGGSRSYILTDNYLLCAGGGGGGNGSFFGSAGGAGGAGGSIGPGGGGGGGVDPNHDNSGWDFGGRGGGGGGYNAGAGGYNAGLCAAHKLDWLATGESGTNAPYGIGNAIGYGAAGVQVYYYSPNNTTMRLMAGGWTGVSGNGGGAAYFSNAAQSWKNTNNANGTGAAARPYNYFESSYTSKTGKYTYLELNQGAGYAGGTGGNNRNAVRGDGSPGGAGSVRSESADTWNFTDKASPGVSGYIKIYKVK